MILGEYLARVKPSLKSDLRGIETHQKCKSVLWVWSVKIRP